MQTTSLMLGFVGAVCSGVMAQVPIERAPSPGVEADVARMASGRGQVIVPAVTSVQADSSMNGDGIPRAHLDPHMPDLQIGLEQALQRRREAAEAGDRAEVADSDRLISHLESILRPTQVHLTLEEVVRRTLANNYTIQTVSYNPAIEATRVVEAEAVFDAVFFSNVTRRNVDQPTPSELLSTAAEFLTIDTGVRKLLSSGALVTSQYKLDRSKQNFVFQTLNPAYTSSIILDMRQPLLRGFGVDFNRSLILIAKNDSRIGDLTFRRQIRDTLREVEELYWRLVQRRRQVMISARELADFEGIYDYVVSRRDFDMTPVQIEGTKADLEFARANFIRLRAAARDTEDRLIAAMNDPEINLVGGIEIVPEDFPALARLIVDPAAEAQTALEHRTEIQEQELRVRTATINVGRLRNAELPRLDLAFTTTFQGLAGNADRSFDDVSRRNFVTYSVGVQFELPVGNRGPRAARRRAQLQHLQAVAQLSRVLEDIILDVNLAVRELHASYDQIRPSFESVEARKREVESIVARAERKDFNTLRSELGAVRQLASTRGTVLNALVEYNIAIIDLERAKGTLLEFNNVVIPTEGDSAVRP